VQSGLVDNLDLDVDMKKTKREPGAKKYEAVMELSGWVIYDNDTNEIVAGGWDYDQDSAKEKAREMNQKWGATHEDHSSD
jgi:hypothetical protein